MARKRKNLPSATVSDIREYFNLMTRNKITSNQNYADKTEQFIGALKGAKANLIDHLNQYDTQGNCINPHHKDGITTAAEPVFRYGLGYAIFGINGIDSGLYSEKSITTANKTKDHVVGATLAGKTAFLEYCRCGFDDQHMRQWLYDNLYLWMTITVDKEEHDKQNISRESKFNVQEKTNLIHYTGTSKILFNLEQKIYYRADPEKTTERLKTMRKSEKKKLLEKMSDGSPMEENSDKDKLKKLHKEGLVDRYHVYINPITGHIMNP
jgi:hypothetical protein